MEDIEKIINAQNEDVVVSFDVTEDKPFNKCFQCNSFLKDCSGPNLMVAGVKRACEFLQTVRVFREKTYKDVADGTGLSLANVVRTLTGKIENPTMYTMCALTKYLLGPADGRKYPCAIPNIMPATVVDHRLLEATRELEAIAADNQKYQNALDNIHKSYGEEILAIRSDGRQQLDAANAETASWKAEAERWKIEMERWKEDADRWKAESESWRFENERKGKLIDKYLDKMIG